MGKKAKFKKIRRMASQMPVINVKAVKGEIVSGVDLVNEGVQEVEGKPIDMTVDYRKKSVITQPLNHNRNMKRMYNKYGIPGVNYYLGAVQNHIKKSNEKANQKTEA